MLQSYIEGRVYTFQIGVLTGAHFNKFLIMHKEIDVLPLLLKNFLFFLQHICFLWSYHFVFMFLIKTAEDMMHSHTYLLHYIDYLQNFSNNVLGFALACQADHNPLLHKVIFLKQKNIFLKKEHIKRKIFSLGITIGAAHALDAMLHIFRIRISIFQQYMPIQKTNAMLCAYAVAI
ncbi:hypothetical protein ACJX0J_010647 [Zea mays]